MPHALRDGDEGRAAGCGALRVSGRPLRGRQIEQMFQRLTALRPQMSRNIEKAIEAGDVALVNNRWQLSGQRPDGQPELPWLQTAGFRMVKSYALPNGRRYALVQRAAPMP